ncbi:MAG: hypothetical protein LBM75_01615, partial [Myxococcales bacterium]|jgi:hypothetical protein|nr:hypothetical protein [Myxococcales bacterium]
LALGVTLAMAMAGCSSTEEDRGRDAAIDRPDNGDDFDDDTGVPGDDAGADAGDTGDDAGPIEDGEGISWCRIVSPPVVNAKLGQSPTIYAQLFAEGVTEGMGQGTGISAQVAYGAPASDPSAWTTWSLATFNRDEGNNDEYQGMLAPGSEGTYAFAFRFRLGTDDYVYCHTEGMGIDQSKLGVLNVTAQGIDWCNLQHPPSATLRVNESLTAYGQVLVEGVTDQEGQGADVRAEFGVGPASSDASQNSPSWRWTSAAFNTDVGRNDEYVATLETGDVGSYAMAFRFKYDDGAWTYCDLGGSSDGFSVEQQGSLEVAAQKPALVDWCNLKFPKELSATPGTSTTAYGQVYVAGITESEGAGTHIEGQLGYGAWGTDGSQNLASWHWSNATFNKDDGNNDEYEATLMPAPTQVGDYAFAYRFRYQGGEWTYCDLDANQNGYALDQQGKLTVAEQKPPEVEWCKLQWPASGSITEGEALTAYGQVWINGITEAAGAGAGIEGQLGHGPQGTDASQDLSSWSWTAASFNTDDGNNDEYMAAISPSRGSFSYAYRFRYQSGAWKYCDLNGSDDGFEVSEQGTLTVQAPASPTVDYCVLQWPASGSITEGESFRIYGQVYKAGVTESPDESLSIESQHGFGPVGTNGSTDVSWTWRNGVFNGMLNHNHEYMGDISPDVGSWAYAFRFRYQGGAWTYCDLDANQNGYAPDQQGSLEVTEPTAPQMMMQPLISGVENTGAKIRLAAQIYLEGVTDAQGQGEGITAELGIGARGDVPTAASWSWVSAAYLGDDQGLGSGTPSNDIYHGVLTAPEAGTYDVAMRFTVNGRTYVADALELKTFALEDEKIDWCNTQWPTSCVAAPGATSCATSSSQTPTTSLIYGQMFTANLPAYAPDSHSQISAQLGIGTGDPRSEVWEWTVATWNTNVGDMGRNYEFQAPFTAPSRSGSYRYVYRFRHTAGWTYCDTDGSIDALGFDPAMSGSLTVE